MKRYKAYYFRLSNKRIPVKDFVNSLDITTQRKFFYKIELLESFGKRLTEPHAKHLEGGIYELRFQGSNDAIRVLYFFFVGNKTILTNAFKKKTKKILKNKIKLAKQRRDTYIGKR